MKYSLDITKILKSASNTLKSNWKTLIPIVFFAWLFSMVASFGVDNAGPLGMQLGPDFLYPLYFVFGVLAYVFLTLLVSIGLMHVFIRTVDEKEIARGDMLEGFTFKKMFSFIGAYILYTLLVLVGLLLLVVPGVYIAVALIPLFYVIIDRDLGPITAIKETYEITKGNWWLIAGITILVGLISLIAFAVFFVLFGLLAWAASVAGPVGIALFAVIAVPAFILFVLFIQSYVGLTHAYVYKELRDHMDRQ